MNLNIFAFAIPFFLFFIGLEYWVAIRTGRRHYFKFSSSIANMNVGLAERMIDVFTAGAFYFVYDYLYRHYAVREIKPSLLHWVALLLATDFLWYWYHRCGHKINLFWGFHVVHHTSEEFNYTAATRITVFQAVVRTLFWAILPVIGFPAYMITTILIVHGIYPFFTHTRLIGKLGVLEYILVTPSHHRVHHASNEKYLDKNYGDMFIIWDKMFGTFQVEEEEPVYGLTKQLESYSFLWQHFHYLVELWYAVKKQPGFLSKLKLVFGSPSDFDPGIRGIVEKKFLAHRRVTVTSRKFKNYVVAQFSFTCLLLFFFILFEHYAGIDLQVVIALLIVITLINCGAIMEQKKWVFHLEYTRLVLSGLLIWMLYPSPLTAWTVILACGFVLCYYRSARKYYLDTIYQ